MMISPPNAAAAAGEDLAVVRHPTRLAALRRTALLDTPAEDAFDRVTRLAARIFGVPIALVSLVDEDRQFFKSAIGLPEPWASQRQTPLTHSFCKHVVQTGEPLVVENSRVHPLVRNNGATTEIGVVAYAGIPLTTSDGLTLGSLCVIDTQPHAWSHDEVQVLEDLARTLTHKIELHTAMLEAERERRERSTILERITDAFFALDTRWRFTFVNGRAAQILGRPAGELTGTTIWEQFPALVGTPLYRECQRAAVRQVTVQLDVFYEPANAWFEANVYPSPDGLSLYLNDITERRRAEEALRIRDRAIASVSEGIVIADARAADLPIIHVNAGFERVTGYTAAEVFGRSCRFLQGDGTDPEVVDSIRAAIRAGTACEAEVLNFRKDGTPFWNHLSIAPVFDSEGTLTHFVGVQKDISEQKRAAQALRESEEQVRQAQKMDAVGSLVAGIAHDFNNLLTSINGHACLALQDLDATSPVREDIEEVLKAGERAALLTSQFLAFCRQQVASPRPMDLNDLVAETSKLLGRIIGEDIALVLDLDDAARRVEADPGQLAQVLVNLASNARDAMPGGGTLSIRTRGILVDAAEARRLGLQSAGRFVRLEVSDSGCGMDAETCARVFDPFFTTKGVQGTGLGLSTVYGIVKQCGGHIRVSSHPDQGTTLSILLPVPTAEPMGSGVSAAGGPSGAEARTRVLVVEDEAAIRHLVRKVLQKKGFELLEAEDGVAALQLVERHGDSIDLVITDVVMPRMGAGELVRQLAARRPGLRVICMSGYMPDVVANHGVLDVAEAFMEKPFTPDSLLRTVSEVLARPAQRRS